MYFTFMFVQKKIFQTTASKLRNPEDDLILLFSSLLPGMSLKDFSSTSCMNKLFALFYFTNYFL